MFSARPRIAGAETTFGVDALKRRWVEDLITLIPSNALRHSLDMHKLLLIYPHRGHLYERRHVHIDIDVNRSVHIDVRDILVIGGIVIG